MRNQIEAQKRIHESLLAQAQQLDSDDEGELDRIEQNLNTLDNIIEELGDRLEAAEERLAEAERENDSD
ncbi:hypothetical protein [Noviherbaspirillum sp.]|uniref:hypothetical protein n=1 Tax=Noviherbaspirillum sp. TaxID=1926288 RepID=UPI002FE42844